ncbi:unnamed protein product [Paramecium octaurelia]|uniref:Dynein heavy chain linker domain-containing protein n=1 Tax=Paramecium octaurelia TaxID=43137 RepID=A0A8S1U9K6_PAROT|nr:unnamed protein product [Paramecium octaurelia]
MGLDVIWDLTLFNFRQQIEDIRQQAKQDVKTEQYIIKVNTFWKDAKCELLKHMDTDTRTMKHLDEHLYNLEEHQLQIKNIQLNKYVKFFEKNVQEWNNNQEQLMTLFKYYQKYKRHGLFWKTYQFNQKKSRNNYQKNQNQLVEIYRNMKGNLIIKLRLSRKGIDQILVTIRKIFPRFYFVSDNDILDMVSHGGSPAQINRHMSMIFYAIDKLELQENSNKKTNSQKMITRVGHEEVNQLKNSMIDSMIDTLKEQAKKSFGYYYSQIYQLQIDRKTRKSICKNIYGDLNVLKGYFKRSVEVLTESNWIRQRIFDEIIKIKIDVFDYYGWSLQRFHFELIYEYFRKPDQFQWKSQLKFYWINNDAHIRVADASLND